MRNAWALFNPETGERLAVGDGHLDIELAGDAHIVWRDTIAEIKALPAVWKVDARYKAESQMSDISKIDRSNTKSLKAQCAARFLSDVPEPDVIDPSDPDAIPVTYTMLYDEYWQTYDIRTTADNPWHLARLIVQKAQEKAERELHASSMAEAILRRKKVQAEITINTSQEPMPDE